MHGDGIVESWYEKENEKEHKYFYLFLFELNEKRSVCFSVVMIFCWRQMIYDSNVPSFHYYVFCPFSRTSEFISRVHSRRLQKLRCFLVSLEWWYSLALHFDWELCEMCVFFYTIKYSKRKHATFEISFFVDCRARTFFISLSFSSRSSYSPSCCRMLIKKVLLLHFCSQYAFYVHRRQAWDGARDYCGNISRMWREYANSLAD